MYLYNYRFCLVDDTQLISEETATQILQTLQKIKGLELVRVAIDFNTPKKSISLLSRSPKAPFIKETVTQSFQGRGIQLSDKMETETLKYEEEMGDEFHPAHSSHPHSHPNKNKKNTHHSHSHSKNHSHEHSEKKPQDHFKKDTHTHDQKKAVTHDHHHHGHAHDHSHSHENHWLKAALGLIWGIGLIALSLTTFNIPLIVYFAITGLTTLMTLYLGFNVYKSAWNALREKNWDTTTLYTISTLTIVAVSIASLFIPGLPMMFEAAPLVLGFWHLGEGVEHTLINEIEKKLDVRDCLPQLVQLIGNPNKKISPKNLIPNDKIILNKGEVIPVDGVLTTKALLYTTRIDGSPHLKVFNPGDEVKAGMRLADHIPTLEMRVTKTYQNSYLSLIAKNIEKANNEKAPVEVFANRILKYFIPGLLVVALGSGIIIGSLFSPALAIQCVISVLVSACPCALSLITPMAVKIGMKKASENGIQFKDGKTLQAAADIDTVVFDLNGTLTQGNIVVQSLLISDKKFLNHIALLESHSDHPTAKKILSFIRNQDYVANNTLKITCVDKSHHSGIKGIIDNETFMIGNKDMLLANGITQINEPYDNPENGSVYIVHGKTVIGQVDLIDPLREDAIATVKQLQEQGIAVHICTGADLATAKKSADLLGISPKNICANTVGAVSKTGEVSKESYIALLKRKGCNVAMVGDAINDIPAIAKAKVGIAVTSGIGDSITKQHAGIVLQQGRLFPVATAFDVAAKTKQNITQNLFVSLTYNSTITLVAAGLFVAIGFALNPALGVALMVLESAIVLSNLYRFKHQEVLLAKKENTTAPTDSTNLVLNSLTHSSQPSVQLTKTEQPVAYFGKLFAAIQPEKEIPSYHPGLQEENLYQYN